MTVAQITSTLRKNPSYLKKGDSWIASNFGCSQKTARTIKRYLAPVKKRYVRSLASN